MGSRLISLIATGLALLALFDAVLAARVIVDPGSEPNIREVHRIYRTFFADANYYDLASAKLLDKRDVPDRFLEPDQGNVKANFSKTDFKFDSAKWMSFASVIDYITPMEERLALHLYDDPEATAKAAGAQVNQEMCGLHLSYMQRTVERRLVSFRNSSDYSIFNIMHSSDGPNFSVAKDNTIFLGNYQQCIGSQLNVIRDELSAINRSAADAFFSSRPKLPEASLLERLAAAFGPLLGYLAEEKLDLLTKNRDKVQLLGMRYCLAGLRYPEWRNDTFSRRNTNFRVAICLPESCDSRSLERHRERIKQLVDFNMKQYYAGFYLDQLYCLPDEQSEMRNPWNFLDSALFICCNLVWLSLVAVASAVFQCKERYGRTKSPEGWWLYLSSWCLQKNYHQLMSCKTKPVLMEANQKSIDHSSESADGATSKVDLEPMEGIRVLSAVSVVASHVCTIVFSNNWHLHDGHHLLSRTWIASAMVVFPAIVDVFFVLTGILTVMILMRMPSEKLAAKAFWPVFILQRYLRIVPLWALVHWFVQSYFRFLGSGPRWDYGTSRSAWMSMCRHESIWSVLLPQANLKNPAQHCNHVGWYLANDIQFACLLVPVFTVLYLRSYALGRAAILASSLLVWANYVWYYLTGGVDARSTFEPSKATFAEVLHGSWRGYVMPQYRCLALLVGLGAGHLLHKYERAEIKLWPRGFVVGGKLFMGLAVYLLCFLPFLSHMVLLLDSERLFLVLGSLVLGSMHAVASVATALFLLLLCTGHLPRAAHFLRLGFFKPLARMAFTTVLVHFPLLYYHSQSLTYLPQLTPYNFVTTAIIWTAESFALSFVVHLLYEMPMREILLKILLGLFSDQQRDKTLNSASRKLE